MCRIVTKKTSDKDKVTYSREIPMGKHNLGVAVHC
jgi:hypothetical protein